MNFYKMDKRIEFISKGSGTDEDGFATDDTWQTVRKCWCRIRGLRGKEFYSASAVQSEDDKVFNCRYFKGLKSNMKIKYNDKIYDITSINDLYEKHEEYEIHAKEIKSNG
ncbi:phage head closure protein [Clostridium botulinum D/C]|uniref:phage head closure protein n=1 Tax=Clostridium botulinum TaxID=1491 RepID=UPI001E446DA3|nr:phage head closure protein [Clostridium botulinum]MCD3351265.1 phage head closure protein [Clostridium botulinum D/C]MCD3360222.1 phage head closure protein [Clostridium botulinum D/C]MCD3361675.1 phage head closure protein [Clostridium botulinum D/C]MCD3366027.1 phage head closure protein [Clostridium botulinum D/C]